MERGKAILAETFYALYDEAGVFEDSPNWREFVPERSSKVTLPKVYERMNKIKLELEDPLKSGIEKHACGALLPVRKGKLFCFNARRAL